MKGSRRHLRPIEGITVRGRRGRFPRPGRSPTPAPPPSPWSRPPTGSWRATPTLLCAIWAGAAAWPASPKTRSATPSNSCEARRRSTPGTRGAPPYGLAHVVPRAGHTAPTVPVRIKRSTPPDSDARSAAASRSTGLSSAATSTCGRRREHANLPPAPPSATATSTRRRATRGCPTDRPAPCSTPRPPPPDPAPAGFARAAPLRPHAPRRSGASLLSSWPNRATANPRTCANTSNPHPQPYGGSPACLDQEPTGADTQSLMYLVTRLLTTPLQERHGVSDAELARRIGITRENLRLWRVNGVRRLPERANLAAVARIIGEPYRRVLSAALFDTGYLTETDTSVPRPYDEVLHARSPY